MKNLSEIKYMEGCAKKMREVYINAVEENLSELGRELPIRGSSINDEMGYPKGLLISISNGCGNKVDCVYDRIKVENSKVMLHQAYYDNGKEDYWVYAEDMHSDELYHIYSAIDWKTDNVELQTVMTQFPQRIYIIEFYPQHGDLMRQGQTTNPIKLLQECACQYKDGIRGATIRPLMLNGRNVLWDGERRILP